MEHVRFTLPRAGTRRFSLRSAAAIALAALSFAQDQAPKLDSLSPTPAPRDAIQGEVTLVPLTSAELADDKVPLPLPAIVEVGERGDRTLRPKAGDPYFLGFAAGKFFPPADERIDPALSAAAAGLGFDGRPNPETYAFVMFSKKITDARVQQLEALGARVISFHPHYALKVAVRAEAIQAVAGQEFVRWIGTAQTWQKLHPALDKRIASARPGESLDVWINVFDSDLGPDSAAVAGPRPIEGAIDTVGAEGQRNDVDSGVWITNGWQQRALENAGIRVVDYAASVRAFRAKIDVSRLEALLALDFVQFVEPDLPATHTHDESTPMIMGDKTRVAYDGATSGAVVGGVIDSGLDIGHAAIDPFVVGWDFTPEDLGPFVDNNSHGTHVGGTMFGNADVDPSHTGMAPALGYNTMHRVFVLKMLNTAGSGSGVNYASVLTTAHTPYTDSNFTVTQRPMVLNNSYGIAGSGWIGTELEPRMLDYEVYNHDQLYVFASGNEGSGGSSLRKEATAKNVLTVGSVTDFVAVAGEDPGTVATSSSRGPTGDDRWKPNVAAVGRFVVSTESNTSTGYTKKSGTSMASPHVTGLALQLCDHYSFLRYNPATLSAVLMAGATTKNNVALAQPSAVSTNHLNVYGTGRVESYKSHYGGPGSAMYFWGYTQGSTSTGTVDFDVNAGATRVVIVTNYNEAASSAGASAALINDFDTYIDVAPFSAANNVGEFTAQQSPRDNTEIRIIDNPTVAQWRIKTYPESVVPGTSSHIGICVIVHYADTTPTPTFSTSVSDAFVQPGDDVTITATYSTPAWIASGVFLDTTSTGDLLTASTTTLKDGAVTNLLGNESFGRDVVLGDVLTGNSRSASWTTHWNSEGIKAFLVSARSDNAVDDSDSETITVDGTAPNQVTNLHSTNRTPNVWFNDPDVTFSWTNGTDNLSGLDGHGIFVSSGAPGAPSNAKDLNAVTSTSLTLPGTNGTFYFNVKSVDKCGNWTAGYTNNGPYLLDMIQPDYVTGLASTTHTENVPSCTDTVTMIWDPTLDSGGSGLAGYAIVWDHNAITLPLGLDIGPVTSHVAQLSASPLPWYFHITPIDNAGNSQNMFHAGPFYVQPNSGTPYCVAKVGSLGCTPAIGFTGMPKAGQAAGYVIRATNVRNNKVGLMLYGTNGSASTPLSGGTLCIAGPVRRSTGLNSGGTAAPTNDCSGVFSIDFSTFATGLLGGSPPAALSIPGTIVNAQFWGRDPGFPAPNNATLSNALQFTICE